MKTAINALIGYATAFVLTAASACATEYHVSADAPGGGDGSVSKPFKTIFAAANVAQPGDVVTVHEGVYRERSQSAPGGRPPTTKRIVYQAAPGEKVIIKGSEIIKGWEMVQDGVWKVTLAQRLLLRLILIPTTTSSGESGMDTPRDVYRLGTPATVYRQRPLGWTKLGTLKARRGSLREALFMADRYWYAER